MNEVLFNKIQCLKEILNNQSSVVFAYLFGSRVKGYANEKSDWDIAVYFAEPLENYYIVTDEHRDKALRELG